MKQYFFKIDIKNRGLILDPRTKILLLITMSTFVLGGIGGTEIQWITPFLSAVPFVLLLTARQYKFAAIYVALYMSASIVFLMISSNTKGLLYFLLLSSVGIITRFIPSIMLGIYVLTTTTVSEFNAAMTRLKISEKIVIPLSVMFRFFPTVIDEFSSINAAMKMRGIALGEKNVAKILEYRLVPLLTCSVKIGEELSAAALTRGLGGNAKRTNVCKIGFNIQDIVAIVLCVIVPFAMMIISKIEML